MSSHKTAISAPDEHTAITGELNVHYIDVPNDRPPLVLLHGLSANAHCFSGLIAAGLGESFRIVAPDLRGRGKTDKPAVGYSIPDHVRDVLDLLDLLGLERVVLAGHSFGGYVAIYIAAKHPERVEKLIIIDAAITLNPRVGELLKPSLDRLTRVSPSVDEYLTEARMAPHLNGFWDDSIEAYFRAEIEENADGSAQSATSASAIAQSMQGLVTEPWNELVASVHQPTLLLNAVGAYGPSGTPALVEPEYARATADRFPDSRYVVVPGNHMTMVFGDGAAAVNREIISFVNS
jgi:pimeloyl-ACP methyl ester carboxylesterase